MPPKRKYIPTGNPVGNPTKYKPEYCALLIEHFKKGYSFASFGAIVDVSRETLYTWTREYPEFLDTKNRGLSHSLMAWEEIGNRGMTGQIDKFSAITWICNMRNRFHEDWNHGNDKPKPPEPAAKDSRLIIDMTGEETDNDPKIDGKE